MNFFLKTFAGALVAGALFSSQSHATEVVFVTSQGDIRVNLHDQSTPETVKNFLSYVESGAYENTLIHRVEPNFVIQGGGFQYASGFDHQAIETGSPVVNEPVWSNVTGTIAMAKLGGNPNSATSQWFFNVNNNSANLDNQNGGFTVFGQVNPEDMPILEKIEGLTGCVNDFGRTPMVNYTGEQCAAADMPGLENFVVVYYIEVIDSAVVTDGELTKIPSTKSNSSGSGSSGGGSSWWLLPLAVIGGLSRRSRK